MCLEDSMCPFLRIPDLVPSFLKHWINPSWLDAGYACRDRHLHVWGLREHDPWSWHKPHNQYKYCTPPTYLTTVLSIPHPTNVTQTIERTVDGWRWRQEGRIIWWLQFQFLQLLTRLRVAQGTPNTKSCQGKKEQREKIPGLYPQSILPAMASESRGCHSAYSNWSIFSYLALYMGFPKQGSEGRWVG